MGEPRGYSWPPFDPGNDKGQKLAPGHWLSASHRAWSRRAWEPLSDALAAEVATTAP